MDFMIESRFDEDKNCWIVAIYGEVDIFNSDEMRQKLLALIDERKADLTIDCAMLEYVDSTGLGALVDVLKHVKVYDGNVRLLNLRPSQAKLFRITNLDKVFLLEGDTRE